jgi:hypothetical protein
MKVFAAFALITICFIPLSTHPQTGTAPQVQTPHIDSFKAAHIRILLELVGISKKDPRMIEAMFSQMEKAMFGPERSEDEMSRKFAALLHERIKSKLQAFDYTDLYLPLYDKNFSDEEILGLISFFQSPIGQKYQITQRQAAVDILPALMGQTLKLVKEAEEEVYKEHPELRIPDSLELH